MFLVFVALSGLFAVVYAALMLLYGYGWRRTPEWEWLGNYTPYTRVSVIVPARDEAEHIADCLSSICAGTYPKHLIELIVVDDHSTDQTAEIVSGFLTKMETSEIKFKLLRLGEILKPDERLNSPKKKAIEMGISSATGTLIVTTDADCSVSSNWLSLIVSVFERMPSVQIVTAPVQFYRERNLFQRFQSLDVLGLMGITGAGITLGFQRMGNGANLAYRKSLFENLGGFSDSETRASGDDMFLLQQAAMWDPSSVFFLKHREACVFTEAEPDLQSFVRQRIRWGTKNAALPETWIKLVLLTVFLFCWSILIAPFVSLSLFAVLMLVKASSDFIFLRSLCRYFRRTELLHYFWPSFALHTVYIALIGLTSLVLKRYRWKGRSLR